MVRPKGFGSRRARPDFEFATLYSQNCAGCHGAQGSGGAAIALGDPVYLAIVDEATMRKVITNGIHGTSMPAFAKSAGGMLTEKQVDAITSGILSRWAHNEVLDGSNPPSYAATTPGNAPMVNRFTKSIALRATVQKARAGARAAPSPMIHSWPSSAIRDCARS